MNIKELKSKARFMLKKNFGNFILVVLLHALLLSIVPLHIVIGNSKLDDAVKMVFFIAMFSMPVLFFVIPNLNPCIIRSFKGTIYEIRNGSTTKGFRYLKNIFKYYGAYLSLTCSKNVFWYILLFVVVFFQSFSNTFSLLEQYSYNILIQLLIILVNYIAFVLILILKGIYNLPYCFSTYVIHDNPQMKTKDALEQSKRLFNGHYKDLLCLKFSFVFWYILLVALAIGLWALNLKPLAVILFFIVLELINLYQTLTTIEMYNEIK